MSNAEIQQARNNLDTAIDRELGHAFVVVGQPLPLTAAIEDLIRAYLVNHIEFAPASSGTAGSTQPRRRNGDPYISGDEEMVVPKAPIGPGPGSAPN